MTLIMEIGLIGLMIKKKNTKLASHMIWLNIGEHSFKERKTKQRNNILLLKIN